MGNARNATPRGLVIFTASGARTTGDDEFFSPPSSILKIELFQYYGIRLSLVRTQTSNTHIYIYMYLLTKHQLRVYIIYKIQFIRLRLRPVVVSRKLRFFSPSLYPHENRISPAGLMEKTVVYWTHARTSAPGERLTRGMRVYNILYICLWEKNRYLCRILMCKADNKKRY